MKNILTPLLVGFAFFGFSQQKHAVQKSETLFLISKKYNVSIDEIIKWNQLNSSELNENQILTVSEPKTDHHIVQAKETPYSISKKYGLTVEEIKKLNPEVDFNSFKIGTVLQINPNLDSKIEEKYHIIQPNETKYSVSKKYNISIDKLETFNPHIKESFPVGYQLYLTELNPKPLEDTAVKSLPEQEEKEVLVESNPINVSGLPADKLNLVLSFAENQMNIRYKSSGTDAEGFDCSGLVYSAFKTIDIELPRTSREMAFYGTRVETLYAQKGDLIFFATNGRSRINHVGIIVEASLGEIRFIHSSSSKGVIISSLNENYYAKAFRKINRISNQSF